jgi:hypothetical protein
MLLLYGDMETYSSPAIPLFLATVRCNILQLFIYKHVIVGYLHRNYVKFSRQWILL